MRRKVRLYATSAILLASLSLLPGIRAVQASQTTRTVLTPTDNAYVDSANGNTNYGGSTSLYTLSYSCFFCFSRYMQSWIKFDLSSIPPSATVTSATLALTVNYVGQATTVGVYSASSGWSESTIDWNNAPRTSIGGSATDSQYVSGTYTYSWNVASLVSGTIGTGSITLVLQPTSSQGSSSTVWDGYWSKEAGSSVAPSLTITYSYVSTSVSPASSSIVYGNSVAVTGTTDPVQTGGTMTLQYSTDQATWNPIASNTGGTFTYTWTPPSAGTFYLRSSWAITWSVGSYTTTSSPNSLAVSQATSSVQLSLSVTSISPTGSVTLTANISPQASDGTVSFQYSTDQVTWVQVSAGTPSSGILSYTWSPGATGVYYLRAKWSGDTNYQSAISAVQTLNVGRTITSLSLVSPASAGLGDTIAITATLRDNQNNPISGATITFSISSMKIGTGTTGSSGSATFSYRLVQSAGPYTITASYDGSTTFLPSSAQSGLVINPWKLIVTSNAPLVPLVNFNGVNYTTDISGKVLIDVGSTAVYSIQINTPLLTSAGARFVFVQWGDGSTTVSRQLNVDAGLTLSVSMKQQYYLGIASSYGSVIGQGWYDAGAKASFSVSSPVDQGNGTQRILLQWSKNGNPFSTSPNGSLNMTGQTSLQASWKKQYYLNLTSPYGNPSGKGWYDVGATVSVSVQSPFSTSNSTRYVEIGFTGTGAAPQSGTGTSVTFSLSSPSELTFQWKTQYFVQVTSAFGSVRGEGWYDSGSVATVSINSTQVPVNILVTKAFHGWTGDANGSSGSVTITVDGPKKLVANWTDDYTKVYLSAGGGVAIVLVVIFALMRRHHGSAT